jgi:polygalacturonase
MQSLVFSNSKNIMINGLTSINSKLYHIVIDRCRSVQVQGVKITAPGSSPNTDGIHVQGSSDVTIVGAGIKTGDDCVSIGPATTNLWIERVTCGPGHGIRYHTLRTTCTYISICNKLQIETARVDSACGCCSLNSFIET